MFPTVGGTTKNVVQMDRINSSVQSGQFVVDHDSQDSVVAGVNDKEPATREMFGVVLVDDRDRASGNKENTRNEIVGTGMAALPTPSMDNTLHHTDKSIQLHNNNQVVLVVPEGDRTETDDEEHIVPVPVYPPPSLDDHLEVHPPPPPPPHTPSGGPDVNTMAVPGVAASRTHCFNDQKKMIVIPVPDPVDPPPSVVNHMGTHPPPPPPSINTTERPGGRHHGCS